MTLARVRGAGQWPRIAVAWTAVGCVLIAAGGCTPARPATVLSCLQSTCYTPRQFRAAYGIQPLADRGISGRGQTVVLLAAAPRLPASAPAVTDLRQDVMEFDSVFGLPAARLQVTSSLAGSASPWLAGAEEVQDTEIVHAVAPDAAIRVVLMSAAAGNTAGGAAASLPAALRLAVSEGAVVSVSYGWGERCFTPDEITRLNSALQVAQDQHVTVVAASGDSGAVSQPCSGSAAASSLVKGVNLPAADPLVLAVGGTTLQASHAAGTYIGETAWDTPPQQPLIPNSYASGGGFSRVFARPAYQQGIPGIGPAGRGVPDVAADASWGPLSTGMALAYSTGGRKYAVVPATGTSAAAPLWAGLIALADQYAGRHLGFVNPLIYQIARGSSYRQAFHDITTGTNTMEVPPRTITGYRASPGWSPVTGWGSPDAQVLVPLLARYASP